MRDASRKVQSAIFGLSVAANAAIFQFLLVVVVGTFVFSGEMAEGPALFWFFSLPLTVLAGLATSFAFAWYLDLTSRYSSYGVYCAFVVVVGVLGPALTNVVFRLGVGLDSI
jgi:hypothetical protein